MSMKQEPLMKVIVHPNGDVETRPMNEEELAAHAQVWELPSDSE